MKQQIYEMREILIYGLGRRPQVLRDFGMPYYKITRIVEGQVKRIELEDKGYIDNIMAHEVDGRRG